MNITIPVFHKHGGTVETITAIEHSTHEGVADWEFRGRVRWRDGSVSETAHIPPWALCHDDTEASQEQVRALMKRLHDYLEANGTWHEPKHKRDGRVYNWTPKKKVGSLTIACVLALLSCFAARPSSADQPPLTYHAVVMYMQPFGEGYTYTLGPMTQDACEKAVGALDETVADRVPPSMQKRLAQCVDTPRVPLAMAGWNCNAVSSASTVLKGTKLWIYSCWMPR